MESFEDFEAHASVVVGTFPEAGFVISGVECAVLVATPVLLTMLIVDKVVFDVLPAA